MYLAVPIVEAHWKFASSGGPRFTNSRPAIRSVECPKGVHENHQTGDEAIRSVIFINNILLIASSRVELVTIIKEVIILLEHLRSFLDKQGQVSVQL